MEWNKISGLILTLISLTIVSILIPCSFSLSEHNLNQTSLHGNYSQEQWLINLIRNSTTNESDKSGRRGDHYEKLNTALHEHFYETSLQARPQCIFDFYEFENQLNTVDLLRRDGYAPETHFVKTVDGYIFEIHRIPAPGQPVVFIMPGIFQTSRDCLINCYGRAIGHTLFHAGYDVWLGNYRGNAYGLNHTYLDVDDELFWDFSNDELGLIDFPAAIDYILEYTGERKINWVGYSLGGTSIFSLLSVRPEYNYKFRVVIVLAPCVFLGNTTSVLQAVAYARKYIEIVLSKLPHGSIFPLSLRSFMHKTLSRMCLTDALKMTSGLCTSIWPSLEGDHYQTNYAKLPFILSGFPSPTSIRSVMHWLQWIADPKFAMFDYGKEKNLIRYGTEESPPYRLASVVAPVVIFYGDNDPIVTIPDVVRLVNALPNVEGTIRVRWRYWKHSDFLFARDADLFVYDDIIGILNYKNKNPSMPLSQSFPDDYYDYPEY